MGRQKNSYEKAFLTQAEVRALKEAEEAYYLEIEALDSAGKKELSHAATRKEAYRHKVHINHVYKSHGEQMINKADRHNHLNDPRNAKKSIVENAGKKRARKSLRASNKPILFADNEGELIPKNNIKKGGFYRKCFYKPNQKCNKKSA